MILFASDFDNTLYFKEKPYFKEADLEAIRQFQKEGNLFGICTGRPKISITIPSDGFVDYDFFICETGSHITLKDGTVLVNEPIDFEIVRKLVKEYESYVDSIHSDYRYNSYKKDLNHPLIRTINNIEEIKDEVIHQITFRVEDDILAKKLAREINEKYPLHAFVNVKNLDIVSSLCDKGKGIELIKDYYKQKIAFIGDSANDLPGLKAADIGFTFHHADESVRKEADVLVDELNEAIRYVQER